MSGALENGRRLRPRSGNAAVSTTDEVRRTRAASKRSAMEDTSKPAGITVHSKKRAVQPVKKRAALANLSNHVNVSASSRSALGSSSNVKCVIVKPTHVPAAVAEGDENAPPANHEFFAQLKPQEPALEPQEIVSRSSSAAIASLERRTVQNLYISKEAKDRVKQGTLDLQIFFDLPEILVCDSNIVICAIYYSGQFYMSWFYLTLLSGFTSLHCRSDSGCEYASQPVFW